MSIPESYHKVYMFKNDHDAIRAEVCKHQANEIGGHLFGQFTTSGSVVIHIVLPPAKRRATSASSDQDSDYLERVERFLRDNYMLSHIGEWRLHHSPSSNKPNGEEEGYIKSIFPGGMSKFLIIVVNMKPLVELSPYYFTDGGKHYEKAECIYLESDNPFSTRTEVQTKINEETEAKEHQRNESCPSGAPSTSIESSQNVGSSTFYVHSTTATSPSHPRQPPPTTGHAATSNPPGNGTAHEQTANNENEKATTKEVVMKNTYDELEKYFGQGKVEIERTRYGDINMLFEHESYHWMLRFPDTFPDQPAKLFRASGRHHLSSSSPCSDFLLEKPLTNCVNILLSIKKNCSSSCNVCKSITKGKLTKPVTITVTPENAKLANVLQELINEIPMTLSVPLSFAVKAKVDGSYRIEFEHNCSKWSVEIPAEFPEKPAEVYKKEGTYGTPQKKTINELSSGRHKEKPLISSDNIMLAIRRNCFCSQCYKVRVH